MKTDKFNTTLDYDKFGHCVVCHKNLIMEQAIDGKVQQRWAPDADEEHFVLNNGSRMRVCICKSCKAEIEQTDLPEIMTTVIKGWEVETVALVGDITRPAWTPERGKKYLDRQRGLEIVSKTDAPKDVLKERVKKHVVSHKK